MEEVTEIYEITVVNNLWFLQILSVHEIPRKYYKIGIIYMFWNMSMH